VSYTLLSGGPFSINAATGVVSVAGALDFEKAASHTVTVRATSSDTSTSDGSFLIGVIDVVENAPIGSVTDVDPSANAVLETASIGTAVGVTARALDPDAADTVSYALLSVGPFSINAATGVVSVAGALDFEKAASHTVTVRATSSDTSTSDGSFLIGVIDVVEGVSRIRSPIAYETTGGKNSDRHLSIVLTVEDDGGTPLAGASVSISISGPSALSDTQSTDASGRVTFSIKNAGSGTYSTTVTDVTAAGLTWDGATPVNSYTK